MRNLQPKQKHTPRRNGLLATRSNYRSSAVETHMATPADLWGAGGGTSRGRIPLDGRRTRPSLSSAPADLLQEHELLDNEKMCTSLLTAEHHFACGLKALANDVPSAEVQRFQLRIITNRDAVVIVDSVAC